MDGGGPLLLLLFFLPLFDLVLPLARAGLLARVLRRHLLARGEHPASERARIVVVARLLEQLAQHADAGPLEPVGIQELPVVLRHPPLALESDRIRWILSHDHLQNRHRVGHRARHGPPHVAGGAQRGDAVAAGEPHGGAEPHQRLVGGGPADGAAGVGAESHGAEVGGHRGTRAPTGARRHPGRVVGVAGVARQHGTEREGPAGRELGQVGLGQDDRARLAQLAHLVGVVGRNRAAEGEGSVGGGQVVGVVVVLHDHGDAVQRTGEAGLREGGIQLAGPPQRVLAHGDDRVQVGSLLVVRLDAVEVAPHQLLRGEPALLHRLVDVRDGGLFDLEGGRARGGEEEEGKNAHHLPQNRSEGSGSAPRSS